MMNIFKKAKSAKDIGDFLWVRISRMSFENRMAFKQYFNNEFKKNISDVFEELTYFLGYATDFGIKTGLKDKPAKRRALRQGFENHLNNFALQSRCKPLPPGAWEDNSLFWIPKKQALIETEHPVDNLQHRFMLYDESIQRKPDIYPSQSASHVFGSLCGNREPSFINFASQLFLDQLNIVGTIIKSSRIIL